MATAFSFSAAYDGARSVIERDGFTLTATIHADSDHGAPWDEEDGHGPVSDWRTVGSKAAGDLELNRDGRSARFYDFAEACKIARRDGWGVNGGKLEGETPRPTPLARHAPTSTGSRRGAPMNGFTLAWP